MSWQREVLTKQTWLRQEGVAGGFPTSEVCPELFLRCPGGRALEFFHDTHARLLVWATRYSLAEPLEASVGATPLLKPRLKPCQVSIVDTTGTEKNKHGVSCVKDGIVLQPLVAWAYQLGVMRWTEDGVHDTADGPADRQVLEGGWPCEHLIFWLR